jgi:tRNA U34 5-carboxymethylaminomethyl modifying enzyme MnmG/GidA
MYYSNKIQEIQARYTSYYHRLEEYHKLTGKNLPDLIALEKDYDKIKELVKELMITLLQDTPADQQLAAHELAHFFMEQTILVDRLLQRAISEAVPSSREIEWTEKQCRKHQRMVEDLMRAKADYVTVSGYLLDMAYGL